MTDKKMLMRKLIAKLKAEERIENLTTNRKKEIIDKSLVNHYKKHDFIPNKWFDWEDRSDASIMIIGQDWGPYIALKKYIDDYELSKLEKDFNYGDFLLKGFSSRTEKFILKALEETYIEKFGSFNKDILNEIFFTMAVLFTRQGKHFRGSHNFDEKKSYEICYPYVVEQIEIVKPKVIVVLGGLALKLVNQHFDLELEKQTLTQVINNLHDKGKVIELKSTTIIPNFHPASHTSPKVQKEIWSKIWDYTS